MTLYGALHGCKSKVIYRKGNRLVDMTKYNKMSNANNLLIFF